MWPGGTQPHSIRTGALVSRRHDLRRKVAYADYVNGALDCEDTTTYKGPIPVGGESLKLGKRPDGQPFQGVLDEVRIIARELTAEEIQTRYRATKPDGQSRLLEILIDVFFGHQLKRQKELFLVRLLPYDPDGRFDGAAALALGILKDRGVSRPSLTA